MAFINHVHTRILMRCNYGAFIFEEEFLEMFFLTYYADAEDDYYFKEEKDNKYIPEKNQLIAGSMCLTICNKTIIDKFTKFMSCGCTFMYNSELSKLYHLKLAEFYRDDRLVVDMYEHFSSSRRSGRTFLSVFTFPSFLTWEITERDGNETIHLNLNWNKILTHLITLEHVDQDTDDLVQYFIDNKDTRGNFLGSLKKVIDNDLGVTNQTIANYKNIYKFSF